MSVYERQKRKLVWVGVILFFGIIIFGGRIKHQDHAAPESKPLARLQFKTLYKTIPDPENAIGLIGFELHDDGLSDDGDGPRPVFNVVMKNIDSQSDNYKSMCREIITDVINTCGDPDVVVNVYDSFEAYSLEKLYEQQGKPLTKEDADTISRHRVAVYAATAEYYDDPNYYVTFYPDANNGLRENEVYTQPDKTILN